MRRRSSLELLMMILAAAAGCASGPVVIKADLDPNDYATCPTAGANRVTGSTFAKQKSGNVVSGAGRPVHLDPATLYSAAVFRALAEQQAKDGFFNVEKEGETVAPSTVMFKCRRTVQADAAGRFALANVAPGRYILSSYISWMKPGGNWVGVWNIKLLTVTADGKTQDFVLNGSPATVSDPPAAHR